MAKNLEVGLLIKVQSELAELKGTVGELKNAGVNVDKLDEQASSLAKTMGELGKQQRLVDSFRSLNTESKKTAESIDKAQQKVNELAKAGKKSGKVFKDAVADVKRLRKNQASLTEQAQKVRKSLSEAGISAKNLSREQKRLTKEAGKTNKAISSLNRKTEKLAKKRLGKNLKNDLEATTKSALGLKTTLAAIGTALAATKVVSFFTSAISGAASLEEQLDKVQAVSNATAAQMAQIKAKSEELGATTRYTATQSAEGFEILARAGLNAEQSISAMPSVLALAQGQSISLAESAQYLGDSVSIMGDSFAKSGRYADVLAKGASQANTTFPQLANAISYSGQYAKEAGLDIENLVGILDLLAQNGLRGERAGTGLRNILAQLQDPASKASKEIKKLGIDTSSLESVINGLAMAGDSGKAAINAFGTEAGPALRALLSGGTSAIDEYTQRLRNAGGAAQTAATTMEDNLRGSMRGLSSVWASVKTKLGEPVLKPITEQIKRLTKIIRELVDSGEIKKLGDYFAKVFGDMAKSVVDFVQNFTLDDTTNKVNDFASNITSRFDKVGNSIGLVYNTMKTGFFTVEAVIFGVASAVSTAVSVMIGNLGELIDFIPGLDGTAEKLKEVAGGIDAVAEEYGNRAKSAFDAAGESAKKAQKNYDELAEADKKSASVSAESTKTRKKAVPVLEAYSKGAEEAAKKLKEKASAENKNKEAIQKGIIAAKQQSDALKTLGVDLDQLTTGMSETERQVVDALSPALDGVRERFKGMGEDSSKASQAIEQTLVQALSKIQTPAGLDAFKAKLEEANLSSEQHANVLEVVNAKANELNQTYKSLGDAISKATSQEELNAQMSALNDAQAQGKISTEQYSQAVSELVQKRNELFLAERQASDSIKTTSQETEKVATATAKVAQETEKTSNSFNRASESTKSMSMSMSLLNGEAAKSPELIEKVREGIEGVAQAGSVGVGSFANEFNRLNASIESSSTAFNEEAANVDALIERLNSGSYSMSDFSQATNYAVSSVGYLDDARLDKLNQSIATAKSNMDSLRKSSDDALASIEQALLAEKGDEKGALKVREQEELKRLREELDNARAINDDKLIASINERIAKTKELYSIRSEKIEKKESERANRNRPTSSGNSSSGGGAVTASLDMSGLDKSLAQFRNRPIKIDSESTEMLGKKVFATLRQAEKRAAKKAVKEAGNKLDKALKGQGY